MHTHRFRNQLNPPRVPDLHAARSAVDGFMAIPSILGVPETWQMVIYRRAFELAQAVARPSLLERDLLGVWN